MCPPGLALHCLRFHQPSQRRDSDTVMIRHLPPVIHSACRQTEFEHDIPGIEPDCCCPLINSQGRPVFETLQVNHVRGYTFRHFFNKSEASHREASYLLPSHRLTRLYSATSPTAMVMAELSQHRSAEVAKLLGK